MPAAERWLDAGLGHLVIGSESLEECRRGAPLWRQTRASCLSLDFRGDAFQGPPAVLAEPDGWPRRVIVMTSARVGSGAGPEIDRLLAIRAAAPDRAVYAAGGVRDAADLAALQQPGSPARWSQLRCTTAAYAARILRACGASAWSWAHTRSPSHHQFIRRRLERRL